MRAAGTPRFAALAVMAAAASLPLACGGGGTVGVPAFAHADLEKSESPVSGKIFGTKFNLDEGSGQVRRIPASLQAPVHPETWVVSLHNYPWSCTDNAKLPPDDGLIVTFGLEAPAADTWINADFGDRAAATLQKGIGTSTSSNKTAPAQKGLIYLETWTVEVGAQISGKVGIRTKENGDVIGEFKATICN